MKNIPVSKLNINPLEDIRKQAYNAIAQKIATSTNTVTTINDELPDESETPQTLFSNDNQNKKKYMLDEDDHQKYENTDIEN